MWINDIHYGFVILQEEIDEQWVNARMLSGVSEVGGLIKCGSRATLQFNGTGADDYPNPPYEIKLGEKKQMRRLLASLALAINATDFWTSASQGFCFFLFICLWLFV